MFRRSRGPGVAVVLAIVVMLIAWAPMMALADNGNSQAPADPPGLSEEPPGNSGGAPGQVAKTETETPPGNSGDAPGQNKTDTSDVAPDQGNSGDAPGQNKTDTSDVAPPKSNNAGGKSGSHQDKGSSGVPEGKGDGPTNGVGGNCDGDPSGGSNTGNGANSSGDFDNTCDTAPSGPAPNGNGGGKSKGKPCAGCVGNADDKNPPGQSKGDNNSGYECEPDGGKGKGNKGVGKGNPAHTGCTPPPCSSWTVSVALDGGTISQSVPSTLHSGSNTVSGVTSVSMTVSAPANHTPASDSDSATLPTTEPCTAALSVQFSPNEVCTSWTLTATVTNGTVRAPHVAGSQSASGATQNVIFDAARGFSADGTATGATSITRSAVFSGHPTCSANVSGAFSEIGGSIIDCDGDGIPDGVDPDISSCSPPPPTCPVDSDQNAGEEIPEGETAESFCELDEVDPEAITCPDDATKNAGVEIPDGETETSFCVADEVLGEIIEKDPKPVFPGVVAGEVLGGPEPQGAVLPFTGGSILPVLIVSLTMLGAGGATLYRRREASEEGAAA